MREKLITATIELINKHGLKFTMDELAALVHVSKRSLYEELASKTELIGAVCQYIIGNLEKQEEKLLANEDLPLQQKVVLLLTVRPGEVENFDKDVYEDIRISYPEFWREIEQARNDRLLRLEKIFDAAVAAGIVRPLNIKILNKLFVDTLDIFDSYKFLSSNNLTYKSTVDTLLDIFFYGLLTDKGRQKK